MQELVGTPTQLAYGAKKRFGLWQLQKAGIVLDPAGVGFLSAESGVVEGASLLQ